MLLKESIENAVAEILKDEKYLDSRKLCYIEESKSNSKFVIPNVRPFKAIEFLASQTISQVYENANYLFFETLRGYHFRSIESLLAIRGHTQDQLLRNITYNRSIQEHKVM